MIYDRQIYSDFIEMDAFMTERNMTSPCTGVCTLDPLDTICIGCFRSRDEITLWRSSTDGERQLILDRAQERKTARL